MSKLSYLVVDARSSDAERMVAYRGLAQSAVQKFGGRYLLRSLPCITLEGSWQPQRVVAPEFPGMEAARKSYDSPEYGAARTVRAGVSDFDMLPLEGYVSVPSGGNGIPGY